MFVQTTSGIMVDGVDVGVSEMFHHNSKSPTPKEDEARKFIEHYQDFKGADLIVVDGYGSFVGGESEEGSYNVFPLYAVYGDKKVVSSNVTEMALTQYYDLWKDKLILAKQKPYILSGDLYNTKFCSLYRILSFIGK